MSQQKSPENKWPTFEEWLAQVQQPAVITPKQAAVAKDVIQQVLDGHVSGHDNLDRVFRAVAHANDVEGLKQLIQAPACKQLKDYASTEVTYCVAHMLVDNSGNDAFAREWMEGLSHSAGNARIHAAIAAQPLTWNTVEAQQMLGMSQLTNIFATGPNNEAAPWWSFTKWDDGAVRQEDYCFVLAAILKMQHPDALPTVDVKNSYGAPFSMNLVRGIWSSESQFAHLIPSLEIAYDMQSPEMIEEMRIGIGSAISNKRLMLKAFNNGLDSQWDAIAKWGNEHVGTSLLHATMASGVHLCDELMQIPFELAVRRLALILDRGARLDAGILGAKIAGYDAAHQLLDVAVHAGAEQMVGHLLGMDTDPTKPPEINKKPGAGQNALQIAEEKAQELNADLKRGSILTMVRAAAARRAAHDVLAELDLTPVQKPR